MTIYTGKAIVTYGRSLISLVIAQSLSSRGIEVISCDSVGMTAASFSRYTADNFVHADPDTDLPKYLSDMKKFALKHKPDDGRPFVIIPAFRDGKILAAHREIFDGIATLAAADFDVMDKVDPKHHLMDTLSGLGIQSPPTWHPKSVEELEADVGRVEMPALIKAVDEVGGRGIDFIDERGELFETALDRMSTENPPPLIQQGVAGEDYCLGVLYHKGELKAHMAYKNLQNLPSEGGAGAMRITVDDAPFIEAANKLMCSIGWTGIAEIDFRWSGNPDDEPYLIEVNPRFWAGIFQSVESNVDFPWLLYHQFAYGDVPQAGDAVIDTTTRLPGLWVAGALKDAFSSEADMDSARDAWHQMKTELGEGAFGMALSSLGKAFSSATNFDEAVDLIQRQSHYAKTSKSEIPLRDDPMSSLGIFFILSSLKRHGKLPPEITR